MPTTPPTIYVNLQGGAIHEILATKGLEDVLIVFSGDSEDCDPDNLVTLNPELPDCIYAARCPDGKLSKSTAKFLRKQTALYDAER